MAEEKRKRMCKIGKNEREWISDEWVGENWDDDDGDAVDVHFTSIKNNMVWLTRNIYGMVLN